MVKAQKLAFFLSVVLLLTVMIVGIFLYALPSVSAEESSDKYVVFNQQCPNGNFVDTSIWNLPNATKSVVDNTLVQTCNGNVPYVYSLLVENSSFKFLKNHKYYFSMTVKSPLSTFFNVASDYQSFFSFDMQANTYVTASNVFTSNYDSHFMSYPNSTIFRQGDILYYKNIYAVDLTLMFGSGNEPTLETCNNLFIADYYPFNADGSVISLDGFSNYNQGVVDTNKSYSTTLTYSMLSRTAFLYDNLGASELDSIDYTSDNKLALLGVIGLPLNSIIRAGSTLTVSCGPSELIIASGGAQINIAYLYNNKLVPCGVLFSGDQDSSSNNILVSTGSINFSMPYDVDTIFIYCSDLGSTVPSINRAAYLADLRVSFTSYDNSIMMNNTWNSGFESGYNSGYNKGFNKGVAVGADKQYSFAGLLDAVVQAPISALIGSYDSSIGKRVGGLLNFEFLGVNLSYFFTGLLSVTIVIVIIRFILARK